VHKQRLQHKTSTRHYNQHNLISTNNVQSPVEYQGFFFFWGGGGATNSVLDRGQREWGYEGSSPLVRSSTQFANEWNPYSDQVVTDVYSTELGIRPSFGKTLEFRRGLTPPPPSVRHWQSHCYLRSIIEQHRSFRILLAWVKSSLAAFVQLHHSVI
jgi:hypothetical protein